MGVFSSLASQIIGVQSALGGSGGGLRWLLRDEFTTDRAAGAVNGTAAEPGPGTRTVVDAEGKITISSGTLVEAAQATPAIGDQGIVYEGQVRDAGLMLLSKVSFSVANEGYPLGFSSVAAVLGGGYTNNVASFGFAIGSFVVNSGAFLSGAYSCSASTDYRLAIVLRAAGAMWFIKGGAYAAWGLLAISSAGSSATVYPTFSEYSYALTRDFIRIPDTLWLPTPLLSYGFDE